MINPHLTKLTSLSLSSILTILMFSPFTTTSAYAREYLSVYGKDGVFIQHKLIEEASVNHHFDEDNRCIKAVFDDWIFGKEEIPVSEIDSCLIKYGEIPALYIKLEDFPEATSLWEKDLYLNATLDIEGNGTAEDEFALSLKIKGRGNSTWNMPKKPIRLKFSKKTSICGFKKAKNYVLLNNYIDPSMMRNAMAMWVARRLEVPYSNTIVPVHLFLNDHYQGAYTLTEKVGINSSSVDIDEETGILFEMDTNYDEPYKFRSETYDLPMMVKDPDFEELYEENPSTLSPSDRLLIWEEDFNKAEQMVAEGNAFEAFDLENAVNYLLVYDLTCNHELAHPKSFYIHKYSLEKGEKYNFGPAWDFDASFNLAIPTTSDEDESYFTRNPYHSLNVNSFLRTLMDMPEFKQRYKERFEEFLTEDFDDMLDFFDSYAALIDDSARLNARRWPGESIFQNWAYVLPSDDRQRHVLELRQWIIERIACLKTRILSE